MESIFNGNEIRDEILLGLRKKVVETGSKKTLAVILAGDDPVCEKYVELKKKYADKLDVIFNIYKFDSSDSEESIVECIDFLNKDEEIDGIMIQIPVDKKFDRDKLIASIGPQKDVDGLRFCLGLESDFRPPVVLSILEAIKRALSASVIPEKSEIQESGMDPRIKSEDDNFYRLLKNKKIVVAGKGFLVGAPLIKVLEENGVSIGSADEKTKDLGLITRQGDILISAVGKAGLIKSEMVKDGAVLIDAGTTEQSGSIVGDIEPEAFKEADYYTPVPGGIGPVTVAMLFKNLINI